MKTELLYLKSADKNQTILCLKLNRLYLYLDMEKSELHPAYYETLWLDQMQRNGYSIETTEVELSVNKEDFTELSVSWYSSEGTSVLIFDNLAIKAEAPEGFIFLGQPSMTWEAAAKEWGLSNIDDWSCEMKSCVPNTQAGHIAAEIAAMFYDVWDLERAPGETYGLEEHLTSLACIYDLLVQGTPPKAALATVRENLVEIMEDYQDALKDNCEYKSFYQAQLETAQTLMKRLEVLENIPAPLS